MEKKRILFIYGFGGSPQSKFCTYIREDLPPEEFEMVCYAYPQQDCAAAVKFFKQVLEKEHFDLIIGTSLGGFITLCIPTRIKKLVLNPCMLPSVELPLLKKRPDHPDDREASPEMIATYIPYEEAVNDGSTHEKGQVVGLFGCDDELLGERYVESFRKVYGIASRMPGGHHGNHDAIPAIVNAICHIIVA